MENKVIDAKDVMVGDVVVNPGFIGKSWSMMMVERVDHEQRIIYLFRPYVHEEGYGASDRTICYIGIEKFCTGFGGQFILIERKER